MEQYNWDVAADAAVPAPTDPALSRDDGEVVEIIEVPPGTEVDVQPPSQVPEGAGSFTGLIAGAGVLAVTIRNVFKRFGGEVMEHLGTLSKGLTLLSAFMSKEASTVAELSKSLEEMRQAIERLNDETGATMDGLASMARDEAPTPTDAPDDGDTP